MTLLGGAPVPLGTTQLGIDSAWTVYAIGALLVIAGGSGVVLLRNPVHCALSLVLAIFGVALLFIDQGANFLAAVQIIVYGGAIVILFLFVIMLLGVDRKEPRVQQKMKSLTPVAIILGIVVISELLVLSQVHYWAAGAQGDLEKLSDPGEDVQKLGQTIFSGYLLPFEMTSLLLVIAVVAAVVLVRRSSGPGSGPPRKAAPAPRQPARSPELARAGTAPSTPAGPPAAPSAPAAPSGAAAQAPAPAAPQSGPATSSTSGPAT